MNITETHLNQIVHIINSQLNLAGIDLDSDLLCDLNDNLDSFFQDKCDIYTSETLSFEDLEECQWLTWMNYARKIQGEAGKDQCPELTESQAAVLFEKQDGITSPISAEEVLKTPVHAKSGETHFSLFDMGEPSNDNATGRVDLTSDQGIAIKFDGYGDFSNEDEVGTVVYIEWYESDLQVMVYGDINSDAPTNVSSLAGARNEARTPENV